MSSLKVIGMSYRTSPVDIREKFAFSKEDVPRVLQQLQGRDGVLESFILSTCNRVEVYGVLRNGGANTLERFLREFNDQSLLLDPYLYVREEEEAVTHLCRVAAGLDSMVIGEPEVFGQVKDFYRLAQQSGAAGSIFQSLFPQVFSLVKKVRNRSGIGRSNVSVSYVAVQLGKEIFTRLAGRSILVLGAGEMAERTVRNLMQNGVSDVLVSNRTFKKAVSLAEQVKGTPIMLHEIYEYVRNVDIVISAIGASEYLLTAERLSQAVSGRGDPLLLIDISVPRSVDPLTKRIAAVRLYNIDDLKSISAVNAEERKREAEAAEIMIREKAGEILAKSASQEVLQAFQNIRFEAEEIRRRDFDSAVARLAVSEEDRKEIETLTKAIVSRVLQCTMTRLKEQALNKR